MPDSSSSRPPTSLTERHECGRCHARVGGRCPAELHGCSSPEPDTVLGVDIALRDCEQFGASGIAGAVRDLSQTGASGARL